MWRLRMLVDGEVKRICITKVDNVKEVSEITVQNYTTDSQIEPRERTGRDPIEPMWPSLVPAPLD